MKKKDTANNKIELIVALMGLIGLIITALFTNWDKLFPPESINENDIKEYVITYSGYVKDNNSKMPIQAAKVSFLGHYDINPKRTDSNGMFYFEIEKPEKQFNIKVIILHDDYEEWNNFRTLTVNSTPEEIFLIPKIKKESRKNKQNSGLIVNIERESEISGHVSDFNANRISGVEISVAGRVEKTFSTSSGSFFLKLKEIDGNRILLRAYKKGYRPWNDYVFLSNKNIMIQLEKD